MTKPRRVEAASGPAGSAADEAARQRAEEARELRRALVVLGVVGAVFVASYVLRSRLGIEWSAESIRGFVAGLGAWGPAIFIAILTFRVVLVIPGPVLLAAAGLCFGSFWGAVYGAVGLTGAAINVWVLNALVGPETTRRHLLAGGGQGAIELVRSPAGFAAVTVISGYPIGLSALVHVAAAVAGMAIAPFVTAVAIGSAVRAATFSVFGGAFVGDNSFLVSFALLAATIGVPMAVPRWRSWLFAVFRQR